MIKPVAAMWHESMEILAMEKIRGMNKGLSDATSPDLSRSRFSSRNVLLTLTAWTKKPLNNSPALEGV
jgi:hypothetical protein